MYNRDRNYHYIVVSLPQVPCVVEPTPLLPFSVLPLVLLFVSYRQRCRSGSPFGAISVEDKQCYYSILTLKIEYKVALICSPYIHSH